MEGLFGRMALLLGSGAVASLARKRVAVFGLGGVGSFAAEALARAGIGTFLLVDHDTVSVTNRNRQLIALETTVGLKKTEVMKSRIQAINPDAAVETSGVFCLPENIGDILDTGFDYLVDAVDTVAAKLAVIEYGHAHNIPVISVMGTGNKLDPARFRVSGIEKTAVCPLCRVMRRELRERGLSSQKVVWSDEPPLTPQPEPARQERRPTPGSVSFVPPVAGMIAAGEVVRDLLGISARSD
jgi:tRNA A37 threonylcarbamoyladenosine dehydratase